MMIIPSKRINAPSVQVISWNKQVPSANNTIVSSTRTLPSFVHLIISPTDPIDVARCHVDYDLLHVVLRRSSDRSRGQSSHLTDEYDDLTTPPSRSSVQYDRLPHRYDRLSEQ
jgi:hypothetical protein